MFKKFIYLFEEDNDKYQVLMQHWSIEPCALLWTGFTCPKDKNWVKCIFI